MLTPLEIHNKEFRKTFRGYSEVEVDEFLDQVVRDFEEILKENASLKQALASANEELDHYKKVESALEKALVVAERTAEEVRQNAHKEAALIVEGATKEAEEIRTKARYEVRQANEELENLRKEYRIFQARLKALIDSFLEAMAREENA